MTLGRLLAVADAGHVFRLLIAVQAGVEVKKALKDKLGEGMKRESSGEKGFEGNFAQVAMIGYMER